MKLSLFEGVVMIMINCRISCRPILSVIRLMINETDSSDFVIHSYNYRPNLTPLAKSLLISDGSFKIINENKLQYGKKKKKDIMCRVWFASTILKSRVLNVSSKKNKCIGPLYQVTL